MLFLLQNDQSAAQKRINQDKVINYKTKKNSAKRNEQFQIIMSMGSNRVGLVEPNPKILQSNVIIMQIKTEQFKLK